jgi:hypothetical protein
MVLMRRETQARSKTGMLFYNIKIASQSMLSFFLDQCCTDVNCGDLKVTYKEKNQSPTGRGYICLLFYKVLFGFLYLQYYIYIYI